MKPFHPHSFRRSTRLAGTVLGLGLVSTASVALAQPMGGSMGGPGMAGGEEEEKPAGAAQAAPKTPGLLTTTPVLPPPRSPRKRWKLLEFDGYYRLRTEWLKNFHQGFEADPELGGAPWTQPLGCASRATTDSPCDDNTQSANMRLRLRPTFNLSEGTAVHTELDLLDNVVLGSTPDGGEPGAGTLGAFGDNQAPPQAGQNSLTDSIVVKRAWAEVALPLGTLKFGRMPNSWGMGIMNNAGGEDPMTGVYDTDAEFGDTVDRASFAAMIPGTKLKGQIAMDWPSTRLVSSQTSAGATGSGQPWDLDDNDDVNQYVVTISQVDTPAAFADKAARGETAFNWGVYFGYRTQSWVSDVSNFELGGELDEDAFVARGYKAYNPNVWLKVARGAFQFELEAASVFGNVDKLDDLGLTQAMTLQQFGGVGRASYKLLGGKLRLGLESGLASGDQWDNKPEGSLHVSQADYLGAGNDSTLSRFVFDREYKVDLILFRELYGAVSNAVYGKPSVEYDVTKSITLKASNITSFAMRPVATPGNSSGLGTEFDAEVGYTSGGFFAGISYGVLFPLAGLDHPGTSAAGFTFDETNVGDAGTSHAIQSRLVLSF